MKTFQQFQEAAALAIPAAVRLAPYVLPAIGAAANLMKGAQPRTPNVQRPSPKITAAETQRRQAAADRKAEARERAQQNQRTGQGELGRKAEEILQGERKLAKDAEYAKQRRDNPALRDAEAKQRMINARREAQRKRMEDAAKRNNLPEELNLDPVTIKRNLEAIRYGQRYAGKKPLEMVTTHVLSYLPKAKAIQPTPRIPGSAVTTIGIGAGMALSDVLKSVAQRNREEQKRKRESLIPSGNQPYGTGKVAQLKQR